METHREPGFVSAAADAYDVAGSAASDLQRGVAEVIALRGWRLTRLTAAIDHSIKGEIVESEGRPHDPTTRSLATQRYLQSLSDALHATGPFAQEPRRTALLAIRHRDRAAFEAYGQVHATLVEATPKSSSEAVTMSQTLLALRLRMLCFDWSAIALVFEAQGHPCEEGALRKRHSRLAVSAARSCPAGWALIDEYLKRRGRSYGGPGRKVTLGVALFLATSTALTFGWHYLHRNEPRTEVGRIAAPISAVPQQPAPVLTLPPSPKPATPVPDEWPSPAQLPPRHPGAEPYADPDRPGVRVRPIEERAGDRAAVESGITVTEGEKTAGDAVLKVMCVPAAWILIDGQRVGKARPPGMTEVLVTVGTHVVSCESETGSRSTPKELVFTKGGEQVYHARVP